MCDQWRMRAQEIECIESIGVYAKCEFYELTE